MKQFSFKGFMVPVFTVFNADEFQTVNYDSIDPYAKYLKNKGMEAVLVHGTTGEGTSLSCIERKKCIEKWSSSCQRHGLKLMVQVAGTSFNEVVQLTFFATGSLLSHFQLQAKYSEQWGVDALLLLPELYFKPRTIEELVNYLKDIAEHVPEMPVFYYHIPMLTGLTFSMPDFMDLAEKEIPNFRGIKYTSDDLDLLPISALTPSRTVFIGSDFKCLEAHRRGFDSFIMTTLNMKPEISLNIQRTFSDPSADLAQAELTEFVHEALAGHGNWVVAMKKKFSECQLPFPIGRPRKPL